MKNYYKLFALTLSFLFLFSTSSFSQQKVNEQDSLALVAIYKKLNGKNWTVKWNFRQPVSRWVGVRIIDGRVNHLSLYGYNLTGELPEELGDLTGMVLLNLGKNNFTGNLPASIGNLKKLQRLFISNSGLTGPLPEEFGHLESLIHVSLKENKIEGPLPASIGMLSQVKSIYLEDNLITGAIPREIAVCDSLRVLSLSNNLLSELIPAEFGTGMTKIRIDGNRITFEDFLPHLEGLENMKNRCGRAIFSYGDQAYIQVKQPEALIKNQSYTIQLDVDHEIYNNEYQWFKDDKLIATTYANHYTIKDVSKEDEGVYTCKITNKKGPRLTLNTTPITIEVNDLSQTIVDNNSETLSFDELRAYPNPVNHILNVTFSHDQEGSFQLTLTDVLGRTVYQNNFEKTDLYYKEEIDVSTYSGGVYMLEISRDNYNINKKITVVSE